MVRNNQSDYRKKLAELLRREDSSDNRDILSQVLGYGRLIAKIENALVVVSDMVAGKSHILAGGFARNLDLGDYQHENSIWENKILSLMSPEEQEEKYLAELQFFHYLRRIPKSRKEEYYLVSKLRFRFVDEDAFVIFHCVRHGLALRHSHRNAVDVLIDIQYFRAIFFRRREQISIPAVGGVVDYKILINSVVRHGFCY